MPDIGQEALNRTRRLREALEAVNTALVHARVDDLLAAEPVTARAVAELVSLHTAGLHQAGSEYRRRVTGDRDPAEGPAQGPRGDDLRREVQRVREALHRCRRLGVLLGEFAAYSLQAAETSGAYDRSGHSNPTVAGRALNTRV